MPTPSTLIAPPGLRLDQVVAHWAGVAPERRVLRGRDGVDLCWREFEAAVSLAAAALAAEVGRDEVVAVVCADEAPFHVLVNALWRLGAAVVLLDRNWGPAIVNDLLGLTNCSKLFTPTGSTRLRLASTVRCLPYPAPVHGPARAPAPAADHDAHRIALYATTSGTTDNPKCVAISHHQLRSAYRSCLRIHDFSQVAQAACLFDINSLGVLGVCFLLPREVGAGTLLYPSFALSNVARSWDAVCGADRVDFVYLVPPLLRLLNTLPARTEPRDRPMLAFCSAAPVARHELRTLEQRCALRVFNCYGLTELCFAVFFGARADGDLASESIGPALGIEARLVDEAGRILAGAAEGELQVTGPMRTGGYLHNAAASRAAWDGEWLRTGDIATRDAQGRYTLCGRKKDMVLRGGYTYYLHELEHYLRRADGVLDACAFKGRDLPSGDELCVVVQQRDDAALDAGALLRWIADNLGPGKVPNLLHVCRRALPRNSNGKVLRPLLVRMHLDDSLAQWVAA